MAISAATAILGGLSAASNIFGASKSASAAKNAANIQAASGREVLAQNQKFYDTSRQDLSPYRSGGGQALTTLNDLLYGKLQTPAGAMSWNDWQNKYLSRPDIQAAGYTSATLPASTTDQLRQDYNTYLGGFPQTQDGETLLSPIPTDYSYPEFNFQTEPGYQFRLNEGNKAIDRAAAANQLPKGGATLKALLKYGQDYASNEYGNAYNRYANNRTFDYGAFSDTWNRLAANKDRPFNYLTTLSGQGLSAAGQGAQLGQNFANMNSQTLTGIGNAQASGIVGQANAWNQGLGNITSTIQDMYTLNQLKNMSTGGTVIPKFGNGNYLPGQYWNSYAYQ